MGKMMKSRLIVSAALIAVPAVTQAQQTLQYQGFYISAEAGVNFMANTTINFPNFGGALNVYPTTGGAFGGSIGYDFVGPRVELEGVYRTNNGTLSAIPVGLGNLTAGFNNQQTAIMANAFYDFFAGQTIVPYIGAGLGIAFVNASAVGGYTSSTNFAYQGILGVGWNINEQFRLNLDGRYYGTTSPSVNNPLVGGVTFANNNFTIMASLQYKFGAPVAAPPPPPPPAAAPSYMVFFDWDRSNLSQQALNTIQQAADAYKATGKARITATGHTDKSGPEDYNMALSLRRANAVKDALVRDGVPAMAISVIGKGETQPLVQTADGVREPQNRRVEIVLQ
jgi:OOP family OmpA-OmpF porin